SASARAARSCGLTLEDVEATDRRLHRARRRLPETADRCVAHALADLGDERELGRDAAARLAGPQARECLFLPHSADAARDALTARLVPEEPGDAHEERGKVDRVVEHEDDARAERRPRGARALERERHVEVVGPEEPTRGAAHQDGLEPPLA